MNECVKWRNSEVAKSGFKLHSPDLSLADFWIYRIRPLRNFSICTFALTKRGEAPNKEDAVKKSLSMLSLMVFALVLCACAGGRPTAIGYKEKAIHVKLTADSRLNLYQGGPHALVLCLYQLKDPNAFNQLVEEKDGLLKLLDCSRFDATVANAKRIVIQPGQVEKQDLDRAEGAKYVAVAAGYYTFKERPTRIYSVPTGSLLGKDELSINLYLGPQIMQDMKGN
jgi:type VI secretion system VasD/TssJ family lipoprotein